MCRLWVQAIQELITYTQNFKNQSLAARDQDTYIEHLCRRGGHSAVDLLAMDISHPVSTEVTSLAFSFLTADEIKSISVTKIDNPVLLDNFNLPTKGGLYDPKLGPMSPKDV